MCHLSSPLYIYYQVHYCEFPANNRQWFGLNRTKLRFNDLTISTVLVWFCPRHLPPPNCASTSMRQNKLLPEKTGSRLPLVLRLAICSEPVVLVIQVVWVRFILMPLFERFDPFPGHRYCHPHPVKLCEMVGPVVVGACHHIRPEPPPCELPHRLVLVVEVVVIYQNLVAFLDFLRP